MSNGKIPLNKIIVFLLGTSSYLLFAVTGLGAERPELPLEAKAVLKGFQQALIDADWAKAIGYCSDEVKKKAAQTESPEAFLRDVIPVEQVLAVDVNRASGWGTSAGKPTRASFDISLTDPNRQYPLGWRFSVIKQRGIWFVDFSTQSLDVWRKHEILKSKWINNGFSREEMQAMLDKANQRLELRLVPLSDKFVIGKPMLFRVELHNASGETLPYTAVGGGGMVNDPMVVQGPDDKKLSYVAGPVQTEGGTEFVEPNETIELVEQYDVRSQYHIIKSGRYTFQKRGDWGLTRPSNTVEVEVLPGQLSAIEDVVEKLTPILPEGWKLTRGQNTLYPEDANSVQVLLVALINPAARKVKNPGISCLVNIILETDGNVIKEFKHVGEYAGHCDWGAVYTNVRDVQILWPGWKENISKALGIR